MQLKAVEKVSSSSDGFVTESLGLLGTVGSMEDVAASVSVYMNWPGKACGCCNGMSRGLRASDGDLRYGLDDFSWKLVKDARYVLDPHLVRKCVGHRVVSHTVLPMQSSVGTVGSIRG